MSLRRAWSRRDENRLRQLWPAEPMAQICKLLGRSASAVKNRAMVLALRRVRQNYRVWTRADQTRLREIYPHRSTSEVARMMGRSVQSICGQARKMKLHKTQAYLASPAACRLRRGDNVGRECRFLKGHVPANKGLRRPGYFRGRMRETQFKKGHVSWNYLPIGTIRMDSDGYLRRKIADGVRGFGNAKVWEFVHRRVWEDEHGPIPKGHRIWWKDRNHSNCALENLELLSGAEHIARTTIHRKPPELKEAIYALIAVKAHITKKEKKRGKEQAQRPAGPSIRDAREAQG